MHTQRALILFLLVLSVLFLPAYSNAQGRELIDVADFFNGAFPYRTGASADRFANQIRIISGQRPLNPFNPSEGGNISYLYYAFAAPATIESFRFAAGKGTRNIEVPRHIEFAVSSSPEGDFQTVAAFDLPESHYFKPSQKYFDTQYDFSVPAQRKISGRYLRITLSGSEYGRYKVSLFSAYGRFDQPIPLREDLGGHYIVLDSKMIAMLVGTRNGTSSIVLKQENGLIQGCYLLGYKDHVNQVVGTFIGGVENNVARLTYTHTESGLQASVALGLAYPIKASPGKYPEGSTNKAYLVLEDGKGNVVADWTERFSEKAFPCAATGRKEKTAGEAMQESLEKTGKVQLYGVNFDFDSDALRPESSTVLDEVAKLAKANPSWKFEVGGHTDSIGSADYNLKLSDRRAASVVRYLINKGVEAVRLKAKGYGATRPLIADAGDDAARAKNRRVELVKQ
ncbi:MAG: OmpA family protein [Betaproteobacteria bacterium]|nr:OmpA family protein [Betaproteobacteria bacterium]